MNAKQFLALLIALVLAGCSTTEVVISPLFGVCANLPRGSTYLLDKRPPVDFDEGVLTIGGKSFNVYIGHNPDFSRVNRRMAPASEAFGYVGMERSQDINKVLFARRVAKERNLYVMFSASGSKEVSALEAISLRACSHSP